MRIGKFLQAIELPIGVGRKTKSVSIQSIDEEELGLIEWYGPWRQYTIDFTCNCTFNSGCLRDIAAYLDKLNREQRQAKPPADPGAGEGKP